MRWRLRAIPFSLLCAATIGCTGALAAQVAVEPSDASGSRFKIVISGPINLATLVDFSRALIDPRIAKTRAPSVELDSPGGSIPAAMAIGGLVRDGGLGAAVARQRTCDSACALVLVAGIERSAGPGSVSIHRPRFEAPPRAANDAPIRAREKYEEVLLDVRAYLKRMGSGDRLLDAMLAVPSGRLRPLSHVELQAFGLSGAGPNGPKMVARVAHLAPSMDAMAEATGAAKQGKPPRGRQAPPQQRLIRAIGAGPPPGAWRASALGGRLGTISGKGVIGHQQKKARIARRGGEWDLWSSASRSPRARPLLANAAIIFPDAPAPAALTIGKSVRVRSTR